MTPVLQTIFTSAHADPPGNCLQAAIASLLDLPLDDVPHFVGVDAAGGEQWWSHLRRWLYERGMTIRSNVEPEPGELYLALGASPRHPEAGHVAIYRDGQLVHDPHPDAIGIPNVLGSWVVRAAD